MAEGEVLTPAKRAFTPRSWRGTRADLTLVFKSIRTEIERAKQKARKALGERKQRFIDLRDKEAEQETPPRGPSKEYNEFLDRQYDFEVEMLETGTGVGVTWETHNGEMLEDRNPEIFTSTDFPSNPQAITVTGSMAGVSAAYAPALITLKLRNQPFVDLSLSVESRDAEWASLAYERLSQQLKRRQSPVVSFFRNPATGLVVAIALWGAFSIQIGNILARGPLDLLRTRPWQSLLLGLLPLAVVNAV
jgi:hypothetical protein